MSDSTARVKPRSTLLEDMARATAARSPVTSPGDGDDGPDRADPLPRPGDPYLAHARRAAKPQMMLFFVKRDYLPDGYSYANLERVRLEAAEKSGTGPVLVVRFFGSVVTEAVIEGWHLQSLCNAIGMHLMPWIWEHPSPREFVGDRETIIRSITFREIK